MGWKRNQDGVLILRNRKDELLAAIWSNVEKKDHAPKPMLVVYRYDSKPVKFYTRVSRAFFGSMSEAKKLAESVLDHRGAA